MNNTPENDKEQGNTQPRAARVYGSVVYRLSIVACLICTLAPILTVAFPQKNVLDPYSLFTKIWDRASPEVIWEGKVLLTEDPLSWLQNISYGDCLMMLGLVLGCSCAGIALPAAAVSFLRGEGERRKEPLWAFFSFSLAAVIFMAVSGILM